MKSDNLRKEIFHNLQDIKSLLLTENQIKVIKLARRKNGLRATELAGIKGISIQNASQHLKNIYTKGYLSRLEETAASGGVEYAYYSRKF